MYEFRNKDRARQLNIFGGMNLPRGIGLTDIDASLDFSGEAFMYFEGKFGNGSMPFGQKIHLEAHVNKDHKGGYPSALVFYRHDEDKGDVFLSGVTITSVYCHELLPNFKWYKETKYQIPIFPYSIPDIVWVFYNYFKCK
jgi:hypothetical protein